MRRGGGGSGDGGSDEEPTGVFLAKRCKAVIIEMMGGGERGFKSIDYSCL